MKVTYMILKLPFVLERKSLSAFTFKTHQGRAANDSSITGETLQNKDGGGTGTDDSKANDTLNCGGDDVAPLLHSATSMASTDSAFLIRSVV